MNKDEPEFAVFCIENIAQKLGESPVRVFDMLTKESDILYGYIVPLYPTLHTQGRDYIANDVIGVMREWGVLA